MDFGHEEFQDGMAQCTESSLAVRRALACLNHRWHTKVRTSFLEQEELKVCVEDCTYENVRFILRLASPGVNEFLKLRVADRQEGRPQVLEVQKLLHPERFVDSDFVGQGEFDDSVVVGPYTNLLVPFSAHAGRWFAIQDLIDPTAAYFLGRIIAHNTGAYGIRKLRRGQLEYLRFADCQSMTVPQLLATPEFRNQITPSQWQVLAGIYEHKAHQAVCHYVAGAYAHGARENAAQGLNLARIAVDDDGARHVFDWLRRKEDDAPVRRLILQFTCTPLSKGIIGYLLKHDKLLPHLTAIDLSYNRFFGRRNGIELLLAALVEGRLQPLEELNFTRCHLRDRDVELLAAHFTGALASLRKLNLSNNTITGFGVATFFKMAQDRRALPRLRELTFNSVNVGHTTWQEVATLLATNKHVLPSIRSLECVGAHYEINSAIVARWKEQEFVA